jgi:hypothetical protein
MISPAMKEKQLAEPLDRVYVRALLRYTQMNHPTDDQIVLLHGCIARRLISAGLMRGSYKIGNVTGRSIRVKSDYFDSREAVTFNDDGFVGFAGWADENNVQPILWGVVDWVNEVTGYDGSDKTHEDFKEII